MRFYGFKTGILLIVTDYKIPNGVQYTLPNGNLARVMEPAGPASLRLSFTNSNKGPISPFTGKPIHPPKNLGAAERKEFIRTQAHVELTE